jgi:N-acetylmuramoyl-L-alanine amidase
LPDFADLEKSQAVKTSARLVGLWCTVKRAENMNFFHRLLALGLCLAGLAAVPASAPATAAAPVRLLGAEVASSGSRTVVALTLDRAAEARTLLLSGPDRFVVDVPSSLLVGSIAARPAGVVRGIRHARQPDGAMRVVFDLSAAARIGARRTEGPRGETTRLVYELVTAAPAALVTRPVAVAPAPVVFAAPARPTAVAPAPLARTGERVVVIDAGHGGKDPGAHGGGGAREKDIVLAAALALQSDLERRGGYRVVLTREADVFLPLPERVAIARRERADLFISLHADSHSDARASGASVYTLSERGGERARALMDAQDWEVDLGEAPRDAQVQTILVDLAQRETTGKSADFAGALIGALGRETPLLRNTHRNAGFFVLLAPDVPAVLLEMGFLTHPGDEARLANPAARRRMMSAVADSIDIYFAGTRAYAGR